MQTIILNISGMTCGGCGNSVTRVLQALDGVDRVAVDWQAGRAEVVLQDGPVTAADLIAAVEDAGFDAAVS